MTPALLTKQKVAELTGVSIRRVDPDLQPAEYEQPERGGRPQPRYDLTALPAEVQQTWAEQQRSKVVELTPRDPGQLALALTIPTGPNLSDEDRAEAERRFRVIEPLLEPDKFALLRIQYPTKGALVEYLGQQHGVSTRSIYNWLEGWKRDGLPALVSKDRSDKGAPRSMTPAAFDFLLAASMPMKGVYGVLSAREIYRCYNEERQFRAANAGQDLAEFSACKYARYLDEDGKLKASAQLPKVSYETMRTWFNRIPEVARTMAREGGEAYRNTQEIISWRAIAEIQPMDYVVMDHRVLDIFCLAPERGGWRLMRPWLTAAIDMRTRKWLAWVIVETPSSDSIAAVLKRVFIDHGLPKALYWDNGKDFRCEWLEGKARKARQGGKVGELSESWRGVLGTLDVRVHHAIAYNARAKIIEPNFGRIADFDRTLPEWCGHKPGARPEDYEKLVKRHEAWSRGEADSTPFRTIHEVAALYSAAIADLNERELEGEGMQKFTPTGRGWMCPNEAWEILARKVERRTVPAELLHFCFAKRRELTVRHGEVKTTFAGRDYHYRLAGNAVALMVLNGQTVEFAYDPLDLGEAAIYYQSRFVGLANCVELRRMGEDDFVEDEQNRRAARREVKKFIRAVHQAVPIPSPETRLARRREVLPMRAGIERPESVVSVPVEIIEAANAAAEEMAAPARIEVERIAAESGQGTNDDRFDFFS